MNELARLKQVELTKVWPNEASDFTPWLADHLGSLGAALGMDLELRTREAPVGSFSLDILAHDVGRDRVVVIENQLKQTDHDHLGKALTYAAGYDASAVVWIAKQIREEHRQALDWLNRHTDSEIAFYGVVVELLQIDDSRPAFNFKLLAFPNEFRKSRIPQSGGTSERGETYRAFFQDVIDRLREDYQFTGARIGQAQSWYAFASGHSGITYNGSFAQGGRVRTEVYIHGGTQEENKALFDRLEGSKREIESSFGEPIEWERLDDRRSSRAAVYRSGSIDDDSDTLIEIRKWMIDRLMKFKAVVGPML